MVYCVVHQRCVADVVHITPSTSHHPHRISHITSSLHPPPSAYRRLALELHPDKCAAGVEDEDEREAIEARFKQFQQAYETLSNPTKRREFDSTDEFDDTLPYDCNPADFFKVGWMVGWGDGVGWMVWQ